MEFGQDSEEWKLTLDIIKRELPNPRRALEIGAFQGGTLAEWRKLVGPEGVVVGVDVDIANCQFRDAILVQGDSMHPSTLNKVIEICPEYDFLFIDGYHSYEVASSDWHTYGPLVRDGGLVAFHDISDRLRFGVWRLWEELKAEYPHRWEIQLNPDMGVGILRK